MERNEPDRPSLTAFVKVLNDSCKPNRKDKEVTKKSTWLTNTAEEMTLQGIAILSNN
ncbi:hypothetical protein [Reinekea thalattae]|uniref:hypothetical protein n=1 Tax=Reinekea thalattae TaxID=2593301 RepID=UPI00164FDF21|nr:hypothetical protein [Reinekea thalattae]